MRGSIVAPVDSMGCHILPQNVIENQSIASQNLQVLFSLLLSSQTKDQYTFAAMQNLRKHFHPAEISPRLILDMDSAVLDGLIKGVGFHAKKTAYMKKISEMLLSELNEKIPNTLAEVIKFPGIGPKMGILYLQNSKPYDTDAGSTKHRIKQEQQNNNIEEEEYGLAVDTHVLRLSQQWKLVFPPTKGLSRTVTPEIARAQLEQIVPREHWKEANPLIVGFGQTVCGSRSKKCDICDIAGKGICKAELIKKPKRKLSEVPSVNEAQINDGTPKTKDILESTIKRSLSNTSSIKDIEDLAGGNRKRTLRSSHERLFISTTKTRKLS
ncbi:DNA glycosylase [Dipodascopsis uninucleata]